MIAWTDFLASRGARFDQGAVADFGDPAGELAAAGAATVVADLSHFGLIGFSGEEAQTFLHGQITNDLRNLGEDGPCSPATFPPRAACWPTSWS
jgi:glycine cleavage system aminomethyltransferase T